MQVTAKENKVNCALAQFQFALGNSELDIKRDIQRACEKIKDPNHKVSATKYLQLHSAELIGNTALHLAASKKDLKACEILLKLGADYTAKNHHNLTVLHQFIASQKNSISEEYRLDSAFVHNILSAHLKDCNFENPSNDNGLSHFHIACAYNNVEFVKAFLQNGNLVNHTVEQTSDLFPGFTPLHFAARFCAFEVFEVLLSQGADVHIKDAKGLTPLYLALEQKLKIMSKSNISGALQDQNEKILDLIFLKATEYNNDVIFIDELGLSQLHVACTFKDSKIAESLLQKVENIDHAVKMDSFLWPGYSALHFAALCNMDTVKLLMKKGADISIKDAKGVTPFDICNDRYKAEDIYSIISLNSIWKNIMLSDGKTRLTNLIFAMRNTDQFNAFLKKLSKNFSITYALLWPEYTPMHLAVLFYKEFSSTSANDEEINVQILKSLCEKNPIMLESQDVHGYTPLHLAFRLNKNSVLDVLFKFLESYPNLTDHLDEDGLSFLHIAAARNNIPLLKQMQFIGCNVNAVFQGKSLISRSIFPGSTALHFAVANGSVEAVDILLKKGADVHTKNSNDMTPIHLLLFNPTACNLLNTPNLIDSVVNGIGLSHLHAACCFNKLESVERLLDNGANINGVITYESIDTADSSGSSFLKQYTGYSPLLIALKKYSYDTMRLLVKRGADIFINNTDGKSLIYSVLESKFHSHTMEDFIEVLKRNDDMKARLKADTGMTELHFSCFANDVKTVEKLISEGADVNAQIPSDSPIFRGFTPLHVGLYVFKVCDAEKVIERLVKKGADVTLPNAASQTALHLAHELSDDYPEIYPYINTMLEAQRDYSLNPMTASGLTHFHIACNVFSARIVETFLEFADVDVNQPIDHFHSVERGYTPLHLAAANSSELEVFSEQLDTVDLLLKHGADVHVEDSYGDTPIFNCLRVDYNSSHSLDIFERIARSGANVNARNLDGHTPLHYYLETDDANSEGLKTLLRMGCRLNTFNSVTNHGYIAKILDSCRFEELPKLFSVLATNFRQEIATDHLGRTAIHNIVSGHQSGISRKTYSSYIDQLSKIGITVDDQDNSGRTALHSAGNFYNSEGIAGLLMAGADVNISDINGQTGFTCNVDTCMNCRADDEDSDSSEDANDNKCVHIKTLEILAIHVKKLQLCGLDVNKQNEDLAFKTFEEFKNENLLKEDFLKELEIVKSTTIGSQSFTLCEFLSETGAVADYPRMSLIKRDAINKYFSPGEVQSLRNKFPQLAGILQLQYRKARARPRLIELAGNALAVLIGFRLPEICSGYIFLSMKNSELMNLVESAINAGNTK